MELLKQISGLVVCMKHSPMERLGMVRSFSEVEEAVWGIFVREIDGENGPQKEVVAVGGESKWGGTIGQIWKYDGETEQYRTPIRGLYSK